MDKKLKDNQQTIFVVFARDLPNAFWWYNSVIFMARRTTRDRKEIIYHRKFSDYKGMWEEGDTIQRKRKGVRGRNVGRGRYAQANERQKPTIRSRKNCMMTCKTNTQLPPTPPERNRPKVIYSASLPSTIAYPLAKHLYVPSF